MGDVYSTCPPQDWRYPPIIDEYNAIIQSICNDYDLPFMNTNEIVGPMWDSGDDWCHLHGKVAIVEAYYLLGNTIT